MLQSLRNRRDAEEGFTLIELMVVVLIIAILLAIAIPTFLGARERAQVRSAQSNLRNAFAAEKVVYTDNQTFTTNAATLTAVEPSLSFTAAAGVSAATSDKTIYVVTANTDTEVYMGVKAKNGHCFYMRDLVSSPTQFAKSTDGSCNDVAAGLTWGADWGSVASS